MFSNEKTSDWFEKFTDQYKTAGELPKMLALKKRHSRRVCEIACAIRESMEWSEFGDDWLAYAIGLLHDVGRFPQYQQYQTFLDAASLDHGDEAERILSARFDWDGVPPTLKKHVIAAVKYHNKLEVPSSLPIVAYRWCALARDAGLPFLGIVSADAPSPFPEGTATSARIFLPPAPGSPPVGSGRP